MKDKSNTKDIIVSIFVIIVIFWLGFIYGRWKDNLFWVMDKYNFISPLLNCNKSYILQNSKNVDLESPLKNLVDKKSRNSWLNHVSIYFRDLNNWYRFGINEKEIFTPASLTKVPTLIAVLKRSESEKWFLDQSVKYSLPMIDYNVHYKPKYQVESDKIYTIRQLVEYMIKYSDNNATQILRNVLWTGRAQNTYKELWVIKSDFNEIQVVDYASFFRILFNSSYLSKENSEYALDLLTKVEFTNWIVAWVPVPLKTAHKFGEYSIDWNTKQIHDCGIVYYPDHPYLLCVMTRWDDYNSLEKTLSEISETIFENINNIYDNKDNK